MTTQQNDDGTADERVQNLGLVVDKSRRLDKTLRNAFCSIIGNKYAAVLARGRSAEWLIKNCLAVLEEHREITGEHCANIRVALDACGRATERRNDVIHGTTPKGDAGAQHRTSGPGCRHDSEAETWPPEEILKVASEISDADAKLFCAMQNAVSPEVMVIGEALAWEQRRGNAKPCS